MSGSPAYASRVQNPCLVASANVCNNPRCCAPWRRYVELRHQTQTHECWETNSPEAAPSTLDSRGSRWKLRPTTPARFAPDRLGVESCRLRASRDPPFRRAHHRETFAHHPRRSSAASSRDLFGRGVRRLSALGRCGRKTPARAAGNPQNARSIKERDALVDDVALFRQAHRRREQLRPILAARAPPSRPTR